MFRKLISEVTFSASLIGELGAYAQRLKREESLRRISVWTTLAAAIVMTVVYLFPPSSANTAHSNDLIRGGVTSQQELIETYNQNEYDIKSIYTALGVSRSDIVNATEGVASLENAKYISSRVAGTKYYAGEHAYEYRKSRGDVGTVYLYPTTSLALPAHIDIPAVIGTSETLGKFAILLSSGNIALAEPPRQVATQECPPNEITEVPRDCTPPFTYKKTAFNATQQVAATEVRAQSRDRIVYTMTATNTSDQRADTRITDSVADVLEYADIVDTGGGIYDETTQSIQWTASGIEPGESYSSTLIVRVRPAIAATAQGASNPLSYDCIMTNTVGSTTSVPVACPAVKHIEQLSRSLPSAPLSVSFYGSIALCVLALFLSLRTRLLREEIRLIRKDINSGTLE